MNGRINIERADSRRASQGSGRTVAHGAQYPCAEAAHLGLITRAVAAAALQGEVDAVIEALLAASPEAVTRTKQNIWKTEDADYRSAISIGIDAISVAAAIASAVAIASAREGITAFVEKRGQPW